MYSYEDRVRAVELYLKLGKRVKATIRQLGFLSPFPLKTPGTLPISIVDAAVSAKSFTT
ncbi:hypothetical protein [Burkholderia vietnamiensis]|uniref:hypothetical protein n=1 Tax=Burkholderia vietnamiensis TaxID=60552 RepID=UPI000AEC5599|nr:hypothetical protein [Burkholderia vietnamiensis]MBR8360974.1 transposase [Burkholderia vietnamiensis]UKV71511.1 transposase [Burkholderia vietnamiensis]HDR9064194.1 transposase [Burkholderia vietnamiensis]HDR9159582.1 transposase [Burkholderia vietnamiensis]